MSASAPPVTTEPGVPVPGKAAGVSPLRRLFNELTRSTSGFIGLCLVVAILLVSLVGPLIVGTQITGDPLRAWEAPSGSHWLGLEGSGKDTLHLLVTGGTTVLMVGFLAATITTVIAVAVGSLAGYFGGRFDALMLQLTDVVMTVPQIVLLAVVGAFYKLDSPALLAVIIGILSWPVLMRSIRAQVLSLKEREFVEAAQLLDVGWVRIVFGEIVPN
ncbi:MAG: ABC transporter permease, partial [Brachybacterium tyrofermentans]